VSSDRFIINLRAIEYHILANPLAHAYPPLRFLAPQSILENPWIRILEQLPETLERKRYGT
jgi:hypothetical protein